MALVYRLQHHISMDLMARGNPFNFATHSIIITIDVGHAKVWRFKYDIGALVDHGIQTGEDE